MAGRPTLYNQEMADKIIDRLANGETVTSMCENDGFPCRVVVFRWAANIPEFGERYDRAMKSAGVCKADQIQKTMLDLRQGKIDSHVANIEINSLKWLAGKFYPRMFGERQIVESENKNLNMNAEVSLSEEDMAILKRFGFKD